MSITLNGSTGITTPGLTNDGSQTITGGTANGVAYLNGSKVLTTGSALTFDGTNLTLGAGSAVENYIAVNAATYAWQRFKIGGTDRGYIGTPNSFLSGGAGTDFGVSAVNNLVFGIGSTERMRLDSSGNLGLGVTPSAWGSPRVALENVGFSLVSGSSGNFQLGNNYYINSSGNYVYKTNAAATFYYQSGGSHSWWNAPSGTAGNAISFTQAMTLDSSGNLLVGNTQTDKGVLTVYNNAASFSSVQAFAYFKGTQASDSGTAGLFIAKYANDNGGAQIFVRFAINNGNNGNGQIVGAGSGAAAFSSYSDIRLKENIVDLPPQLGNINALRPVEFDYKDGSGHQIGFVAQEMQEIYPDCVIEDNSEEKILSIAGWSKTEARLVKAIQEQQAMIVEMKTKLDALESK